MAIAHAAERGYHRHRLAVTTFLRPHSLKDRNATLWSSMVIRSKRHSAFFSGDTGLTTEYATLRERLGPFDLVMLEVGAFHPSWGDPTALSGLNNRHQYVDFKYCFASRQTNFDFDL